MEFDSRVLEVETLRTPDLWDPITIIDCNHWRDIDKETSIARELITRSGELPLSLSLVMKNLQSPSPKIISEVVYPFSDRLRNLSAEIHADLINHLFRLPSGSFQSLEKLSIPTDSLHLEPIRIKAPHLRNVSSNVFFNSCIYHGPSSQILIFRNLLLPKILSIPS
jgi:hypothetical protein